MDRNDACSDARVGPPGQRKWEQSRRERTGKPDPENERRGEKQRTQRDAFTERSSTPWKRLGETVVDARFAWALSLCGHGAAKAVASAHRESPVTQGRHDTIRASGSIANRGGGIRGGKRSTRGDGKITPHARRPEQFSSP